ncbi:isoleucyl-tRNA synthetase [Jaminaea rosea]|uniref:isoleucine--tRNA ligase n=1 Tax=Jaminaea rosea TaxID=1569628 RepID=A0A316V0P8_9BASI|nr:isoleucyl-tRNA synthetase [Jaminaea rosea]PWN31127.1 isoleucyl-tRNA synthetase [Jaminaea rosea]
MVLGLSRAGSSLRASATCHCGSSTLVSLQSLARPGGGRLILARRLHSSPSSLARRNEHQSTLNLPKTAFAMRANAAARDHLFSRRTNENLYRWQRSHLPATHEWHLQDGPPYANGSLHMGHALNKILKDIVNRYQLLRGRRVLYKPGWDTHGLPIELKVFSQPQLKDTTARSADPLLVRRLAREFAQSQVDRQREEFKEFGIMADWEETYHTFDAEYESRQLEVFAKMVEKGLVYRAHRPVYYSPTTRTALAEAELEYNDAHEARSVFVRFPLVKVGTQLMEAIKGSREASEAVQAGKVDAIIWTTTPWSLPGNMALAVNPEMEYSIVRSKLHGYMIVAANRVEYLSQRRAGAVVEVSDPSSSKGSKKRPDTRPEIGRLEVLATFSGSTLIGSSYRPPFDSRERPILPADYVTDDSGTGLVHTAAAHGLDDYHLCAKHGLLDDVGGKDGSTSNNTHSSASASPLSPIDLDGRFTSSLSSMIPGLAGQPALGSGTPLIISHLSTSGSLLAEQRITHRYPYDWRSKQPVMMLATDQWFVDVEPLKPLARQALENVEFVPDSRGARERLARIIESRTEWCVSRQRAWGVPLPVVYEEATDGQRIPLLTPENVRHIADLLREKGTDYWWSGEAEQFVAPQYRAEGKRWTKGTDTLDVWFDSGVSWLGSGARTVGDEETPADLYLEGTDQHRGWFQSSLLTKLAHSSHSSTSPPAAPFKRIATHGFVQNSAGEKMSKSLNNFLGPLPFIKGGENKATEPAWGSDVLRFWAAGVSCWGEDARVGWLTIKHAGEGLRKLRNTLRFLLANLPPSRVEESASTALLERESIRSHLTLLDKHVLSSLTFLSTECQACYEQLDYPGVVRRLSHFANTTLSNVYFAVVKDTLYADAPEGPRRLAALAVCEEALRTISSALAPIAPNLVEEAHHYSQGAEADPPSKWEGSEVEPSFFHGGWREVREARRWREEDARPAGAKLLEVRDAVLKLVAARPKEEAGGSSAAYDVLLGLTRSESEGDEMRAHEVVRSLSHDDLAETFIAASVEVIEGEAQTNEEKLTVDGVTVWVRPTHNVKCPRCWRFAVTVEEQSRKGEDALCGRCTDVLEEKAQGESEAR